MAITRVTGQNSSGTGSGLTLTMTLTNNPTAGNLVVVGALQTVSGATMTCKDANNNAYVATTNSPSSFNSNVGANAWVFYLKNAPANANKAVTITNSSSATLLMWVAEYAGADTVSPLETDAQDSNHAANTHIISPSVTTVNNGDMLFCQAGSGSNITPPADSPWTIVNAIRSGNAAEDYLQATAGAQAAGFAQDASVQWTAVVAAFKPPGVADILQAQIWL